MYKLLLSWRYLRTRFIALASIVSVTLGVATLIVVNSVMSGFVDQMQDRLHGILSDVEVGAPGLQPVTDPQYKLEEIREIVGEDLEAVTYVVRTPALMNFEYYGRQFTQQVVLIGIDGDTYGDVADFLPFLQNENKKDTITFTLEEDGYDPAIGPCGWPYRRDKAEQERQIQEMVTRHREQYQLNNRVAQVGFDEPVDADSSVAQSGGAFEAPDSGPNFVPLPSGPIDVEEVTANERRTHLPGGPTPFDPHARHRPKVNLEELFDPARDQNIGVILGKAIAVRKTIDENGDAVDVYMLRPGDDISVTLPGGGSNPTPIMDNFTVVDFYSSNMFEYDSSFVFMPLKELQSLRGWIDPLTGASAVSAIQIKTKPGANLSAIRDKLNTQYSKRNEFDVVVQTWQDTQRPLLSAVNMELTILNILLFLIIAVAGFGILATFFMIVVEKTKDIGILKALGAPSRGVMSIFLGYGLSLGTVGTLVGIGLGLLFVANINEIADVVAVITGQEVFDPTIYYFDSIPTIVNPMMVVMVAIGAISIAVLASVLPALRAARLHPVEALRYE